jgi:hypothetical protein
MRQKTVFTNPYDVWAQQERDHGRNAQGNQSFQHLVAFSYDEPIGAIVAPGIVLYRDCQFSVTTSRHQRNMRMATTHYRGITAKHVGYARNVGYSDKLKVDHQENLAYFKAEITNAAKRFKRARQKDWPFKILAKQVENANAYCEVFKLKSRFEMPDMKTIEEAVAKDRVERKREIAEQNRIEGERRHLLAENLTKWLAGDVEVSRYSLPRLECGDYLRIKPGQSDIVQTTRGIEVPVPYVQRAWRQLLPIMEQLVVANLDTPIRVGEYQITRIDADGVPVGCHRFSTEEIKRFGAVLNALPK